MFSRCRLQISHKAAGCQPLLLLVLAFGVVLGTAQPGAPLSVCPNPPVASITSSSIPNDVCIPANLGGNPIDFFDDFSWKSFVAAVWPAQTGNRGKPDPNQPVTHALQDRTGHGRDARRRARLDDEAWLGEQVGL